MEDTDMEDGKFWLRLWLGLAIIVFSAIVTIVAIRSTTEAVGYGAIQRLIAKGIDPIAAGCAIWGTIEGGHADAACVLAAARTHS